MLEVIGAAPGSRTNTDWFEVWRSSPQCQQARAEIDDLIFQRLNDTRDSNAQQEDANLRRAFAAPFAQQMREVMYRIFQTILAHALLPLFEACVMPYLLAVYWLRLLRCSNDSTRTTKPDVLHLRSPNNFPAVVSANHAALCDPAITLRGT